MKIDRGKITAGARKHGRLGLALAKKAGLLYFVMINAGALLGAIGGYHGILWLHWPEWLAALTSFLLFFGGAFIGFALAQVIIMGFLQDIMVDAGIKVGKKGWRAAIAKLEKRQAEKTAEKSPETPPENP